MSGSVFLNNLDDFIMPAQACVNPLVQTKIDNNVKSGSKITLETDTSTYEYDEFVTKPDLIRTRTTMNNQKIAAVSLSDCLACSGCVTSAETLLIQEQSFEKLLNKLNDVDDVTIIVIISPNSRASIADYVRLSPAESFLYIATALKQLGIKYVFDASSAGDIALMESREEFMLRYRGGRQTSWVKPVLTTANSFTSVNVYQTDNSSENRMNSWESAPSSSTAFHTSDVGPPVAPLQVPMLTSNCPGWICYAEKTSPQALPYVSTVKSPQQIIGTIVKNILLSASSSSWNRTGNNSADFDDSAAMEEMEVVSDLPDSISFDHLSILDGTPSNTDKVNPIVDNDIAKRAKKVFVVSIQPCFDKKLEASRKDFYHSQSDTNEVDLVLSTAELWSLLEDQAALWHKGRSSEASSTGVKLSYSHHVHSMDVVQNDDESVAKKVRMSPDVVMLDSVDQSTISTSTVTHQQMTSSQSVCEYLLSLPLDNPSGCDSFEAMFRMFSADGQALVTSVDANAGSGGYAEYVFKYAAQELYGVDLWSTRLVYKEKREGKNPDMAEIDINTYLPAAIAGDDNSNTKRLKFARAYGFRNIQTVMMDMKRGRCDLDFIEVMACPSGCNNGGGQIKSYAATNGPAESVEMVKENISDAKERARRVDALFHAGLGYTRRPDDSLLAKYLYDPVRLGGPMSKVAMSLLHTRYHAVPKLEIVAPLATKW